MKRRNLSGIYIFEKFEDEKKREPTCFEDCTEATKDKWLNTYENEELKRLVKVLVGIIKEILNKINDGEEFQFEHGSFLKCSENTQEFWLNELKDEEIKDLAKSLSVVLRRIGDVLDLYKK